MKKTRAQKQRYELHISQLASQGDGVAYRDDKAFFVPFAAPGDRVLAQAQKTQGRNVQCKLLQILSSGSARVTPPCPLFQTCGACDWQHVAYDVQCDNKARWLQQILSHIPIPFTPSPAALGYRRLARLHARTRVDGSVQMGFHARKGRHIVDTHDCPMLVPSLREALAPLRQILLPTIPHAVTLSLSAGTAGAFVHVQSPQPLPSHHYETARHLCHTRALAGVSANVDGISAHIAGDAWVASNASDGQGMRSPHASFGQANDAINLALGTCIRNWLLERAPFQHALELFAGAGNLTLLLLPHLPRITTVEWDTHACQAARHNVDRRQETDSPDTATVSIHEGDAVVAYPQFAQRCDLVVLDPPRKGCEALCHHMKDAPHRTILYVSCNPLTLARDLAILAQGQWRITAAHGFDMFAQTRHVEVAVCLER